MSADDDDSPQPTLQPGQTMPRPYRETRNRKSKTTRAKIKSNKTGRKGRKTITENHKKALVEKHNLDNEEKTQKLAQKKLNEEHVKQQMDAVQARLLARPVNPEDIARIRTDLFNIVCSETERARLFLEGKSEWNSNQVRLYGMLLNKVMPDLSQKFSEVKIEHRNVNELSREELEAIVVEAETETFNNKDEDKQA